MTRTRMFFLNSMAAGIYQIVILIVGFITPRIMIQTYGSEVNGLISSITQFINYFNLVEAGLSGAAIYALYEPLAKKEKKIISGIVNATNRFYCQSGVIFSILLIGLSIIYPIFIKSHEINYLEMLILVLILGASGVIEFFSLGKYRALLTANQELYVISIASSIYQILSVIVIAIMAYFHFSVVLVRAVSLIPVFVRSFILYFYVKIHYKYLDKKEKPINQALNKRWDAMFLNILGAIHSGVPMILATILTDLVQVSIFGVYNIVLSGIGGIVGIFNNGLSSSFGNIIAMGEKKILQKSYNEFEYMYYVIITIMYGTCLVMILPFIKLYTRNISDVNYCINSLAILITLNGIFYNLKTPQGMLVISAGHYRETRWQTVTQGVLSIILGSIFGYYAGISGIVLGSICSNLYRDIDLMFYVPRKIVGTRVTTTFKRELLVIINIVIIYNVFQFYNIPIENYLQWIVYATIVFLISILVVLITSLIFDRGTLKDVLKRIKYLFNRVERNN